MISSIAIYLSVLLVVSLKTKVLLDLTSRHDFNPIATDCPSCSFSLGEGSRLSDIERHVLGFE